MSTGSVSVSVALCTYNGEAYVREQLLSILNQSGAPDEIVVSDDNSIDATLAIVESTFSEWFADHPGSLMRSTV
ncbi:MAG: glycosyltransferase, partial [Ilumatobacteraceae bacterium]|nr:glycosyltransferase [Ilumatobacteraceae bacterium]